MRTRFAPSPTGPLHLGHALSALTAFDLAMACRGAFLLRFEDIDWERAKSEWEDAALRDLKWLGISLSEPPVRQSGRLMLYADALDRLWQLGLLYQCHCTRGDIRLALSAPQEGDVPVGPDGPVYPGTCRNLSRPRTRPDGVLRIDMRAAADRVGDVRFHEMSDAQDIMISKENLIEKVGDVVLARRGMGTSYHLSVVVDDAAQGITHVVRGRDLLPATGIHVVLQRLLGFKTPLYLHHELVRDADGRRLAKRHDARAIDAYRRAGATPYDLRRMVGLPL